MFTNTSRPSVVDVQMPFAVGDIFAADSTTTVAKIADIAVGNVLLSGGVGAVPAWGKVTLTSHVSGILPAINGGTGVANTGTLTNASNTTITGGGQISLGGFTVTIPATDTVAMLGVANAFTAAQTITATNGLTALAAATQDAVRIAGRAGGTSSYIQTVTTAALTASRTFTLPDAAMTITGGGTLALGGFTLTVPATGTAGLLGTIQTWSQANTFSGGIVISSGNVSLASGQTIFASSGDLFVRAGSGGQLRMGANGSNDYLVIGTSGTTTGTTIVASARLTAVSAPFALYGVESSTGMGTSSTSSNVNGQYTLDFRRQAATTSTGAHNARAVSGSIYGAVTGGQTNSGAWTGMFLEALRNYTVTSDAGTLTDLMGARINFGHSNQDASTPTTTTVRGLYLVGYRSTGTIGTMYGLHIDNGSTTITPTTGYQIKIENAVGTTAYAIHAGTGLTLLNDTTDSTSTTTGSLSTLGGVGVGKRLTLDGATGKTIKYVNGTANAAVAVTFGAVGPTGSTAGNQVGWIRIDVGGTDRYIPYW